MSYNATENSASRRIATLLDEGSFVEIGGAVTARSTTFNLQEKAAPSDGVITGYGVIDGNLVYVYSQDADVLGGALGEMHAKKIARIYDMAMKMGAPVIGLIDCAGLRLQEATDALEAFGSLYYKQALASGVIPQVTAIFGMCGGGLAVVPGLTDFTFMEAKDGKLFVNSPNALEGNEISKCNTASAEYQSKTAGLVDGIGAEAEILGQIRDLVCMLPANNEDDMSYEECTDDLNRICADIANASEDTAIALAQIADNQILVETKKDYAKEMVTGFIRLNGMTVGVVANRSKVYNAEAEVEAEFDSVLTVDGCKKATDFVNFCDAFSIPVLTLTNVTGFAATVESEKNMASAVAKLTYAFANATVPKVNVIVGKAFGSAYVSMNSKSIGADLVYAWPTAEIGMMDAKLAVQIMYADADAETLNEKAAEYKELQSSPNSAAARGYVDAIIEPADTRKYVIGAFEMLFTKREDRPAKKHGTV
ncbi:acyl-CoA carboxylase subunit beta [Mediterraneibacter faecis]|uniref:acyl-CoA carboxylase subunit beta n=1 Tax=Mediterraneibacter faecis TaxID=592978 RepID=UPI001D0858C8|nr:carboxyl transferase domain-containing protein [Mediterraneibacter faecis]MCB5919049.1 carboxyl transferase [Lachnospiraceae bacterium 210521-DFI.1.105]MCB6297032.1 carboxyl transferase [Mediterraneibacter faecis]MCB6443763.1 carboxyl transferase [Mediterraneibacter faecis]MCQ5255751.1 carboxyl transferase [Mediterraneibacter faecis]MCQ5258786.1 carboxyl transferase [Mediterraneibacter faecis]